MTLKFKSILIDNSEIIGIDFDMIVWQLAKIKDCLHCPFFDSEVTENLLR